MDKANLAAALVKDLASEFSEEVEFCRWTFIYAPCAPRTIQAQTPEQILTPQ